MKSDALSDSQVKQAKTRDKQYKLTDGKGLFVIIRTNGAKWWRFKYRFADKYREISMGVYPDVTLKQARIKRNDARALIADGRDPSIVRQADKVNEVLAMANSFEAVATEWLAMQTWIPASGQRVERRLERDIYPWLGKRPINEITAPELLACIKRVEKRGAIETAHRILQSCDKVFKYAIASGRAERSPAQDIKGALSPVAKAHFASITDPKQIGQLLRATADYKGGFITRIAINLAPLVFVRPKELRHARWDDIHLDAKQWRYFVTKTKTNHVVPLSAQAIALLEEIQPLTGGGMYVFPSVRDDERAMSENTITGALRRLGYSGKEMTGHGFRSMASTLLHEQGWLSDAIEVQLAHTISGVKGVYNYAQHLDTRTEMMQSWADYLDGLKVSNQVTPIRQK